MKEAFYSPLIQNTVKICHDLTDVDELRISYSSLCFFFYNLNKVNEFNETDIELVKTVITTSVEYCGCNNTESFLCKQRACNYNRK